MLRKIRIAVSLVFFTLITYYLIDFAGVLPAHAHILAHLQFVPALLAFNVGIVGVLLLLTFLFGRFYCSTICPLGIYQDVISWLSKRIRRKKYMYRFRSAKNLLRFSLLAAVLVAFLAGFTVLLSLLDPYSMYARIAVNLFKPAYLALNNLAALLFEMFNNYTFYYMEVVIRSLFSFVIALLSLFIVSFMAYKYGRLYCNTICPVGTLLGTVSKYARYKVQIDQSACNGCGVCEKKCKASCVNSKEHLIDYSRCVDCFDCLSSCKQKALKFALVKKEQSVPALPVEKELNGRRLFLTLTGTGLLAASLAKAQQVKSLLSNKKAYKKQHALTPPGSKGADHLLKHCTACHLCISKCPSHVLTPAFLEYGVGGIMQPRMSFEKGFCNFDCTVCSEVCPNKAILPLSKEEKHVTQVGKVVFVIDNCIVNTDGTSCGACSEHCPTQAVSMKPYKEGLTLPSINTDLCVGCGGCEYVCPVRPYRAIYIEGNAVHEQATPFQESEKKEVELDGFGF